jgi:hypothetical protein
MLTEVQKSNISKLSVEDLREILYICQEELGIIDIDEAKQALGVSRQRVYQLMNNNNTFKIGKHKFLMINAK